MTKGLGRGLSAFLDTDARNPENQEIVKIAIDSIEKNPFQPRQTFAEDSLNSLAESIKRKGIIQPILVHRLADGSYQLIAGERRLRASKIAGLEEIPAIIANMSKEDQLEVAILENIQREDLNPLEEAYAYKRLMNEFNHTQEELAEILGKSRSHIANMLRLLTLPEDVKNHVKVGALSFGHARALVGMEDAGSVADRVVKQSLTVRQTENLVRRQRSNSSGDKSGDNCANQEILRLADQISTLIGLKSNVKLNGSGGTIEINFKNFEELDFFIRKLNN
ncbi:MAG: ParB/RepB/Spo0J family partition protein [Holosporaceae bacterium]|jgi:ParB family chromosome partitioning protein|nr:ParB/RepB/Spo0J family partition protein [Holosporaceae bacterium]